MHINILGQDAALDHLSLSFIYLSLASPLFLSPPFSCFPFRILPALKMATASVVPSVLYFTAPLFTTALGGVALARRATHRVDVRPLAERATAYAMIAALAVASTLVGALPLGDAQAHGSGRTRTAAALQAFLGILGA